MTDKGQIDRQNAGVEGDWICVGSLAGPRGVKGDVRLKSFTEDPEAIFSFGGVHSGPGGPKLTIKKVGPIKEGFAVRVSGVSTPEDAQTLRGARLYVSREEFDDAAEDEFYLADLIGLTAKDESGETLGFVKAVENYGSEDLLELVLDAPMKGLGRHVFVPFRRVFVPDISISDGTVIIAFAAWQETQVSERDSEGGND